jgi:hypothetical protein
MSVNEFLKIVRRGDERFFAEKIIIHTKEEDLRGSGNVYLKGTKFEFWVTIADPGEMPKPRYGVSVKSEFWRIEGILEQEIKFFFFGLPAERQIKIKSSGRTR